MTNNDAHELATFGAGCFWGVEHLLRQVDGVHEATSGYMGGNVDNPTYEQVCTGLTGHAEVVHVRFDPALLTFGELLDVFFDLHDPTTPNRQGPDYGPQYRSVIFFHSEAQRAEALAAIERWGASGEFAAQIVTEVSPAKTFWPAEDYHQRFIERTGRPTCHIRRSRT